MKRFMTSIGIILYLTSISGSAQNLVTNGNGFYNDYLHYNFGWDGSINGYYRTIILPEVKVNGSSHINDCIIGITP